MNKNLANINTQRRKKYSLPDKNRLNYSGILLDFNERTTPISEKVTEALKNLSQKNLSQYPNYDAITLKVANYAKVSAQEILLTNGSDQAIDLIFRAFTEPGDKVIIPSPSFGMFYQYAEIAGCDVIRANYEGDNFLFPTQAIMAAINNEIKLIIICNPNNPSGTLVELDAIAAIAAKAENALILVDEAYFEFSQVTAIALLQQYSNIIIIRTFSKAFGLAGLRLGYIIAPSIYINELTKIADPYAVNVAAVCAATAALDDLADMNAYVAEVKQAKIMLEEFLRRKNIIFYNSGANFLLIHTKLAKVIWGKLADVGILTRNFSNDNLREYLRISIGSRDQMKYCITQFEKILTPAKYAFLDRDGTLIFEPQDDFQVDRLDKLKILDGVIPTLQRLLAAGFRLVMVSNQNGIGTETFPSDAFAIPHQAMLSIFRDNNIEFDAVFICPHLPEDNCACRKPKTGLVNDFLHNCLIDRENSFMCGDRDTDAQFAQNIGIKFIAMPTNGVFSDILNQLASEGIL